MSPGWAWMKIDDENGWALMLPCRNQSTRLDISDVVITFWWPMPCHCPTEPLAWNLRIAISKLKTHHLAALLDHKALKIQQHQRRPSYLYIYIYLKFFDFLAHLIRYIKILQTSWISGFTSCAAPPASVNKGGGCLKASVTKAWWQNVPREIDVIGGHWVVS